MDVDDDRSDEVAATYSAQYPRLVGIATLLVGSRSIAEEVVQDVFAAAVPRWADIRNHEHYLTRSVVNRSRSYGRGVSRARSLPRDRVAVTGEPELDETWRLLRGLPDRQRAVLVLRIHLDLADREIAELLGCSEPTVRSLAFRALASLRKELS